MIDTHEIDEINSFFETYARLFDAGRWTEFSELFHAPAMTVRGDGNVSVLASNEEAATFFRGVADAWKREGYEYFTISGMRSQHLGARSRLATFTWHMQSSSGEEIKQWQQSYQLVKARDVWVVLSSTFHIEDKTAE